MSKDYYVEIEEKEEKLTLPSEREHKKKKIKKQHKGDLKQIKWIFYLFLFGVLYFSYEPVTTYFMSLLKSNPTVYSYYLFVETQITNTTLAGLFFVNILGTLFFLILPSEALFIYYLSSTQYFVGLLIIFAVLGNLVGMSFNYFFGRVLGERVLKWMFKEKKFYNYKEKIDKYGGYIVLFGNIFPGPIELLAVFFGGFKFPYMKYLYLVLIGRTIKYCLLFVAFFFFWDQIMFYYTSSLSLIGLN